MVVVWSCMAYVHACVRCSVWWWWACFGMRSTPGLPQPLHSPAHTPSPPLALTVGLMGAFRVHVLRAPKSSGRNQGWLLMSFAPPARQPYRLLRSTCWLCGEWWASGRVGEEVWAGRGEPGWGWGWGAHRC